MNSPPHPGTFAKSEILDEPGLTVTAAASGLGVTRAAHSAMLNGRARLSSEMALRIEKAFGVSMETRLRTQNSFDIAEARKREREVRVAPFKARIRRRPVAEPE